MSGGGRSAEEHVIPLAQMNGVAGEVAILNQRRLAALAEIDRAAFS